MSQSQILAKDDPLQLVSSPIRGGFKKLVASATGLSAVVSVSVDEISVSSTANKYATLRSVSLSINGSSVGANGLDTGSLVISTWYSVWVIWNGVTTAGLLSISETAPTMPVGYTHKTRVGWIRTDASGNKYPLSFIQYGRRVQYKVASGSNLAVMPQMCNGIMGTSPSTYAAVSVVNFVPTTASRINCYGACASNLVAGVAPNNSYGAINALTNPPPIAWFAYPAGLFDLTLESTDIYVVSSGTFLVACYGWEDNI